ncbi:MAG: hypothetical protein D6800_15060 [Candidatus Zixiibacteriota bacterium]|nr:MAG: hypothetical protein D6800_15060 [candidate division Zixibacteria bacterium]
MRKTWTIATTLLLLLCGAALAGQNTDSYLSTISSYFDVSYADVFAMTGSIPNEEVPVVYFIASKCKSTPDEIMAMRQKEMSWMEVAGHCGLTAASFYTYMSGKIKSKTFAPIFEKFNSRPLTQWKNIELTDSDVINLVNLRLIYSSHDYNPFQVMEMRDLSTSWPRVDKKVALAKADLLEQKRLAKK